ncbi:MAG: Asp-tRNA(Asn)/Glu-tRNA(Gln) amidotransferase subunit GatC [Chloroflexota bacterium]|nr:MAG: Asp-tRNA(Asn)/Glu-tRNA(Gln) amidotransferase subunit GatC [Chloroflexota bacterium]
MRLSREQVQYVAHLARLGISEDEIERFAEQLSAILEHFATIQQIDTEAIPPTALVVALQDVMRDDVVTPSYPRDVILANAPREEDGYLRVKAVLE